MLRFTDGVNVDTSGPYRTLQLHDGWYVVGNGTLEPVRDEAEAKAIVSKLVGRDLASGDPTSPVQD